MMSLRSLPSLPRRCLPIHVTVYSNVLAQSITGNYVSFQDELHTVFFRGVKESRTIELAVLGYMLTLL